MRVSNNLSDEKLLKLIAKSREAAFAELFERYWKILLDKALKILKQREMAEDVVQEVFTDLWKKRTGLKVGNVAAYLHTSVKLTCTLLLNTRPSVRYGKIKFLFPSLSMQNICFQLMLLKIWSIIGN